MHNLDMHSMQVALATEPATRAYSHCTLARAMHAAGMPLEETTREYSRSIEAQESPLAHYGMAQMLIRKVPCCPTWTTPRTCWISSGLSDAPCYHRPDL